MNSNNGGLGNYVIKSSDKTNKVKCNSLYDIKPKNGYTYLFMDCEGCAPDFIKEYGEELSSHPIHTILYEEDNTDKFDYTPVNNFIEKNNFKCSGGFHKVCRKNN